MLRADYCALFPISICVKSVHLAARAGARHPRRARDALACDREECPRGFLSTGSIRGRTWANEANVCWSCAQTARRGPLPLPTTARCSNTGGIVILDIVRSPRACALGYWYLCVGPLTQLSLINSNLLRMRWMSKAPDLLRVVQVLRGNFARFDTKLRRLSQSCQFCMFFGGLPSL